jgi:glutamate dehydrogenase
MTTTGIMSAFRALIEAAGEREEELNLMLTGGPDGDLGANEIQCYRGRICLIIDGGCVLFDPQGLDAKELAKIAFRRNTAPRAGAVFYPPDKLGPRGFVVPIGARNITLPDGRRIEDGALFHRTFLIDPANRTCVEEANIRAFIPCGGKKDTINQANVRQFVGLFAELRFIVEGANVFFDDVARRHIAASTPILQIKDSSANKGGVFSSSVAEVLTAFLLQEQYEATLLDDVATRCALVRDILTLVGHYAALETGLLLRLHQGPGRPPLFELSELSSERIFAFQEALADRLPEILADEPLVWQVMEHYVPAVLRHKLGRERILNLLATEELQAYRDAILTKKLASLAFYRFGHAWEAFLVRAEREPLAALRAVFVED